MRRRLAGALILVAAGTVAPIAVVSTTGTASAAPAGPALSVDVSAARHPISPDIYGMNFADPALVRELHLTSDRWGGNDTSRYIFHNNTFNLAADWYFENTKPKGEPRPAGAPRPQGPRAAPRHRAHDRLGLPEVTDVPPVLDVRPSRQGRRQELQARQRARPVELHTSRRASQATDLRRTVEAQPADRRSGQGRRPEGKGGRSGRLG